MNIKTAVAVINIIRLSFSLLTNVWFLYLKTKKYQIFCVKMPIIVKNYEAV
jgi:hypothetical protein